MQGVTFLSQVRGSALRLYHAVPRDRQTLKSLHQDKVGLIKQAGLKKVFQSFGRTMVNLVLSQPARGASSLDEADLYRSYPFFRYLPDSLAREIGRYLSPPTLPLALRDSKNQYTCYQLTMNEANQEKIEQARRMFASAIEKHNYVGWADDIDKSFDPYSSYYVVENREGIIIAAARVIQKTSDNFLPFETGFTRNNSQYKHKLPDGLNTMEITSFCYEKGHGKSMRSLFPALARHASLTGVERIFCLLDDENIKTKELYLKVGFKASSMYNEKIFFPTFGRLIDGRLSPTFWTIMEMGQLHFSLISLRSLNYY